MFGEGFVRKARNGMSPLTIVASRTGHMSRRPRFAGVSVSGPNPMATWGIALQIADGEYDYPDLVPRKADKVIDVGANIGLFSLWAALRGASVTAYEPAPVNYEHLVQNVRRRPVSPIQAAVVADKDGSDTVTLYLDERDPVRNTLLGHDIETRAPMMLRTTVPAVAMSHVLSDSCDLLKLDCEGAEFQLILEADDATLRRTSRIIVEFHRVAGEPDDLLARLRAANFDARILAEDPRHSVGMIGAIRSGTAGRAAGP
jgi:FkbM family methyltransferase